MIECSRCKKENPDDHKFCGDCGVPLDPSLASLFQYVDVSVRQQVDSIAKEQFKDQEIESEATKLVAVKLITWAKIGIPLLVFPILIFGGALAFFGFDLKNTGDGLRENMKLAEEAVVNFSEKSEELSKKLAIIQGQLEAVEDIAKEVESQQKRFLVDVDKLETKLDETKDQAFTAQLTTIGLQTDLATVDKLLDEVNSLEQKVGQIEDEIAENCFTPFFDVVQPERWSPVEVGTSQFDIIEPPQPIQGLIGIKFTDFGQPIGAIIILPNPDNQNFRVVMVVNTSCQPVEDYKIFSRGGPKDTLENFDTLEMRIGSDTYHLRLGMGADIEINFEKISR